MTLIQISKKRIEPTQCLRIVEINVRIVDQVLFVLIDLRILRIERMNQIGVFNTENEDQDRIGDVVFVFVDVRQELIAHLILEAFEWMRQLKELITTGLRRR